VKVIDFGIAKHLAEGEGGQGLTQTGMFLGKLKYASPEQAGFLKEGEHLDPRSDLYSFGIVLYEMLAGRAPFQATNPHGYILKHVTEKPLPIGELNPDVKVIAVQSDGAPAMWHAWRNRNLEPYPTMKTEHEGLATRVPFEMTNQILWELLADFILVTDAEINETIRVLARDAKQVVEGAGAASLAGALKLRDQLRGKKVVGIVSGGNLPLDRFARLLA